MTLLEKGVLDCAETDTNIEIATGDISGIGKLTIGSGGDLL